MSLPDHMLDPEDDDYCEYHEGYLRPCRACHAQALIERAEERYKETYDDNRTA